MADASARPADTAASAAPADATGSAAGHGLVDRLANHVPAWSLAVIAMLIWHVGSAISVSLIAAVGSAGTAWLRLSIGALILIALYRPNVRGMDRSQLGAAVVMGAITGLMTLTFLATVERLPFGTAVAIGFMGPLALGVLGTRRVRDLAWPVFAILGVLALTEPWNGDLDLLGLGFGVANAATWALYIVMSQRVGGKFTGVEGLAIMLPVAAVVAGIAGVPAAIGHITWGVLGTAVLVAILVVVLSFALDMLALRRLSTSTFGTISALQPGVGAIIGAVALGQAPGPLSALGTVLVVIAGVGVTRADAARHAASQPPGLVPPATAS